MIKRRTEKENNYARHKKQQRTNGSLCARVHKGLDRVAIDFNFNVEHSDSAKGLRVVLQSSLQICSDILEPDGFLDPLLRVHIEWVVVQCLLFLKRLFPKKKK